MLMVKMYGKLLLKSSDLLFGFSVHKQVDFLNTSQWWSRSELRRYQTKKVLKLISYASKSVPFYRNFFKKNKFTIKDFKNLKDLEKLPIVTKKELIRNSKNFISDDFPESEKVIINTGGTTGKPLSSYTSKYARSLLRSSNIRGKSWAGIDYPERTVTLAGSSLVPNESLSPIQSFRNLLERNVPLSAVSVNDTILESYISKINKFQPKVIRGYPSSIFTLADYIKANNTDIHSPKVIFTTAEMLLQSQKEVIESVFSCRVFNHYSNPESMTNAYECSAGGLHLGTDITFVEIVDGKIIATDMNNLAMPMIRYDTEDMAELKKNICSCGRQLPLIKSLNGRKTDILSFDNGTRIGGPALTLIFKEFNLINYQVIQETGNSITINLVTNDQFGKEEIYKIENIMQYHCGKDIKISINVTDRIALPSSSKWRFIINKNK